MDLYSIPGFTLDGKKTKITIASGPVIIRNNKVLLHRAPSTGKYQFLGGRLEDSSTVKKNAIEKPRLEGLEVTLREDIPPLLITGTIKRANKKEQVVLIHYLGEVAPDSNPTRGEWNWFTLSEIGKMHKQGKLSSKNVLIAAQHFLKIHEKLRQ